MLRFSFSTTERTRVYLYENKQGLVLHAMAEGSGSNSRIEITKDAVKAYNLNLDGSEYLTFGYDGDGNPIMSTNAPKGSTSSRLGKNGVFSNKKIYETLCEKFALDNKVDNFLKTSELLDDEGISYFNLEVDKPEVVGEMSGMEAQIEVVDENTTVATPEIPSATLL